MDHLFEGGAVQEGVTMDDHAAYLSTRLPTQLQQDGLAPSESVEEAPVAQDGQLRPGKSL